MIKTASSTLLKTESLHVKLSVSLLNGANENNAYRIFSNDSHDYLTFEPVYYIAIQYKQPYGTPWNNAMVCHVNQYNIVTLRQELRQFYSEYSKPDTFIYYKSGNVELSDYGTKISRTIGLKGGDSLTISPKVINDPKSSSLLPGVQICINFTDYACELSTDEFEAFVDIFSTINMRLEAIQLINSTLLLSLVEKRNFVKPYENKDDKPVNPVNVSKPKNLFTKPQKETVEETVDRLVKEATINSLDDL